jgi:hypothetical protein
LPAQDTDWVAADKGGPPKIARQSQVQAQLVGPLLSAAFSFLQDTVRRKTPGYPPNDRALPHIGPDPVKIGSADDPA